MLTYNARNVGVYIYKILSMETHPSGGTRQMAASNFIASSMLAGSRESTNRQSIVIASS